MKTYHLELTADQLRLVSQALMAYEHVLVRTNSLSLVDDTVVGATFMKVSDALEDMYNDQGIQD